MHVKLLGHGVEIRDAKVQLPSCGNGGECDVYGPKLAYEWAWKNVQDGEDPTSSLTYAAINPRVLENADNYAWFATAFWFDGHFLDVNYDKSHTFTRRDLLEPGHMAPREVKNPKRQVADESGTADPATQTAGLDILPESGNQVNGGMVYDDDGYDGPAEEEMQAGDVSDLVEPTNCRMPADDAGLPICDYIGEDYSCFAGGDCPSSTGPTPTSTPASSVTLSPDPSAPASVTGVSSQHASSITSASTNDQCALTSSIASTTTDIYCQCGNVVAGEPMHPLSSSSMKF